MTTRLLFAAFVLVFASASAFADVYRWTDAKGVTVFSSVPPEDGSDARNVVVVAKEKPRILRGTRESAADQPPSNAEVLDRVDSLARQVQAQQYAQATMPQYEAAYSTGYYSTPAPSYYPEPYYDPYYYPQYYGGYGYPYGYYPPVTVFVRPRGFFPHRTFVRPFVHGNVAHSTFGHGTTTHGFARGGGAGAVRGGGGGMRGGGGGGGRR